MSNTFIIYVAVVSGCLVLGGIALAIGLIPLYLALGSKDSTSSASTQSVDSNIVIANLATLTMTSNRILNGSNGTSIDESAFDSEVIDFFISEGASTVSITWNQSVSNSDMYTMKAEVTLKMDLSVPFMYKSIQSIFETKINKIRQNFVKKTVSGFLLNTQVEGAQLIPAMSMSEITFTQMIKVGTTTADITECGKQAIQPDLSNLFRIVGGKEAVPHSWPWAAALKFSGQFYCGATLINNQWVMTAAHCEQSIGSLRVQMGYHDRWSIYPTVDETVSKWISHSSYDSITHLNDIALVKLANPIYFSNEVSPACLPNGRSSDPGEEGYVIGWGKTNADGTGLASKFLRQVGIPVNEVSVCKYILDPTTQLCAGVVGNLDTAKDSCQGDSGSPFLIQDNGTSQWFVAGIVSFGEGCYGRGVYTKVLGYDSWIQETITNNS